MALSLYLSRERHEYKKFSRGARRTPRYLLANRQAITKKMMFTAMRPIQTT